MNRLAVITGGTKGIGLAVVRRFAAMGFDIATCSRNVHDLSSIKEKVKAEFGVEVFTREMEASNRESVKAFGEFVKSHSRVVDVLVNNVGYFEPGRITEESAGVLEAMMNTNLYSAYHLTRSLAGDMKLRKSGHIFNMCSVASIRPYPNGGSYYITKFALLGFSKVLREELKSFGIRVTSVLPGATLTDSWEGANLPDDRFIKPEDVAEMVWASFSLSPQSVVEEIIIRPVLGDI